MMRIVAEKHGVYTAQYGTAEKAVRCCPLIAAVAACRFAIKLHKEQAARGGHMGGFRERTVYESRSHRTNAVIEDGIKY